MSNEERKGKNNKIHSTPMWRRISKAGNPYIGGNFDNYWVTIFQNNDSAIGPKDYVARMYINPANRPVEGNQYDKESKSSFSDSVAINLYANTSKKTGLKFLSGVRGKLLYHVYPNSKKMSEKSPDYNLVVYDREEQVYENATETERFHPFPPNDEHRAKSAEIGVGDYLEDPEQDKDDGFSDIFGD